MPGPKYPKPDMSLATPSQEDPEPQQRLSAEEILQAATTVQIGGPVAAAQVETEFLEIFAEGPEDIHLRPKGRMARFRKQKTDLQALCDYLERELGALCAALSATPSAAQGDKLHADIGMVSRQLRRYRALLANLLPS